MSDPPDIRAILDALHNNLRHTRNPPTPVQLGGVPVGTPFTIFTYQRRRITQFWFRLPRSKGHLKRIRGFTKARDHSGLHSYWADPITNGYVLPALRRDGGVTFFPAHTRVYPLTTRSSLSALPPLDGGLSIL